MPYKPYTGTPGQAATQAIKSETMAKELGGLAQDVVMQDAWQGSPNATAEATNQENRRKFPKKFGGISKPSKPLSNAIKKKRMNFRLKKFLGPKSPLMVLNELVGSVSYTFIDTPTLGMAMNQPMHPVFSAQCSVDGETFVGSGPSKQIAKNICAEHAIQHIVTKRCLEAKKKREQATTLAAKMEDETPLIQLASLALFKLFNDWQAQGYSIPGELIKTHEASTPVADVAHVKEEPQTGNMSPKKAKKVPDNPTERHPVQLLNELKGPVFYSVSGESGVSPNVIFTMTCNIEGNKYEGVGKNKKDAKKHCAMEALKAMFNIQYPGTLSSEMSA